LKKDKKSLTLAITGHRDMIETKKLRDDVDNYLENIITNNLQSKIVLLSPLADGADRFIAKLFLEKKKKYKQLSLIVPMPFEKKRYMEDFDSLSKKDFLNFLKLSDDTFKVSTHTNDTAYRDVGIYVASNSNILLAIWDGIFNGKVGGTSDIVEYACDKNYEVVHFPCNREMNQK